MIPCCKIITCTLNLSMKTIKSSLFKYCYIYFVTNLFFQMKTLPFLEILFSAYELYPFHVLIRTIIFLWTMCHTRYGSYCYQTINYAITNNGMSYPLYHVFTFQLIFEKKVIVTYCKGLQLHDWLFDLKNFNCIPKSVFC